MTLELQHVSIPMPKGGHDDARSFYGQLLGRPPIMARDPFGNRVELTEWR